MSSEFWIIHVTQTVRVTHSKVLARQADSNTQVTPEGSQLDIQLARDLWVEVLAAPQALSSDFSLPCWVNQPQSDVGRGVRTRPGSTKSWQRPLFLSLLHGDTCWLPGSVLFLLHRHFQSLLFPS